MLKYLYYLCKILILTILILFTASCDETAVKLLDITQAQNWALDNGVKIVSDREATIDEFNIVYTDFQKMPISVTKFVAKRESGVDVILGTSIVEHPNFAYLKGVHPRGWPEGTTWDMVCGASGLPGRPSVVAIYGKSGSINTLAHEYGHTLDECLGKSSATELWKIICQSIQTLDFTDYEKIYPDEAFAEGFAKYCWNKNVIPQIMIGYFDNVLIYTEQELLVSSRSIVVKDNSKIWIPLQMQDYIFSAHQK